MKNHQQEEVLNRLQKIETFLKYKDEKPLNFVEAAQYLSISHSQLYKYTSQRKIPFHKPTGKYLYFFKHELDGWIVNNSKLEIKNEKLETANVESEVEDEETEPP